MIKKVLMPFLAVSFVITFNSCNNGEEKKDESKIEVVADAVKDLQIAPPAFTPFKLLMVMNTVADFDKWKSSYMSHDSMRLSYGITHYHLGRGTDNPNMILVFAKIEDFQKAKDFASSPKLKDVMKAAGVTGKPEISYSDVIWNDNSKIDQTDRMMVSHKVKDFDAWKKVFDEEGKEKRMENGLIDRGLARGIDDPNMVYIVFAISDMAKAKARVNSPDLKKIMTEAGVTGPPQIIYYQLVD